MKLKKLNEKQIALTNEMMLNLIGGRLVDGRELGATQFAYCNGGTAATFGQPSSDRITEVWTEDALSGRGYWSQSGGSSTYADSTR